MPLYRRTGFAGALPGRCRQLRRSRRADQRVGAAAGRAGGAGGSRRPERIVSLQPGPWRSPSSVIEVSQRRPAITAKTCSRLA